MIKYVTVHCGWNAYNLGADASVEALEGAMLRAAGWAHDYGNEARYAAEEAFRLIQSGAPWDAYGEIEVGGWFIGGGVSPNSRVPD